MKLYKSIFGVLLVASILAAPAIFGGGDYKAYQDRSLTNTFSIQTELSDEEIAVLVALPRFPEMDLTDDSIFIADAEWVYLNENETTAIHFKGCRGRVVFNLEETVKK